MLGVLPVRAKLCMLPLACDMPGKVSVCDKLCRLPPGYDMLGVFPVRAKLCMLPLACDMPGKVSVCDKL